MIASILNYKLQALLVFLFTLLIPASMKTNLVNQIDRDLEDWNLSMLAEVQNTPGTELKSFTTDGCSGGLSEGWLSFAKFLPAFKKKFGDKPPWEACCVTHDRAYWKGEVENGYDKRLKADIVLRQCVVAYGVENSEKLSTKYGIDKQTIEKQFVYASELMFHAVRVGGKPCSPFPWRWGYGWPYCVELPAMKPKTAPESHEQ